jgi:hypothetical protein
MKLVSLRLPLDNQDTSFRGVREINFALPKVDTYGWRVLIHGQVVTVIVPTLAESPQGGRRPEHAGGWVFARSRCVEQWDSGSPEDYKKPVQEYESEPCGPRAAADEPKAVA